MISLFFVLFFFLQRVRCVSLGSSSVSKRRVQFVTVRNAGLRLSRSSVQVKFPGSVRPVVRVPQRRNSIYAGVFSFHVKLDIFWRKMSHV